MNILQKTIMRCYMLWVLFIQAHFFVVPWTSITKTPCLHVKEGNALHCVKLLFMLKHCHG
jgi:hypothetical protein